MSYLVDTNVLSELRRKQPDPKVVAWMQARPRPSMFLSVLTLGEIRKGIERIEEASRKQALLDWLEIELPHYWVGRLLKIDAQTADRWGRLMASAGRPLPAIDGLLAATALQHDLTLVTQNARISPAWGFSSSIPGMNDPAYRVLKAAKPPRHGAPIH